MPHIHSSDQPGSRFLEGLVGRPQDPASFPPPNYLIDEARYDYEGNWCFCRFDSAEVPAARFGFGRGKIDLSDYGVATPPSKSFLWLHIELLLEEGAVLWLCTDTFRAEDVSIEKDAMAMRFAPGTREIFNITGWPRMQWRLASDNGEAAVDMRLNLQHVTILPDNVMPHNLFAMWLAVCRAEGTVRFGDRMHKVAGTAFYDHPRINVQRHDVPALGWYLYTPTRLADGSHLAAYYTEDARRRPVENYCFGYHVAADGTATWLGRTRLEALVFDGDDKPCRWRMAWAPDGRTVTMEATVRGTPILKAWGGASVPQTRKANGNFPLAFDAEASGLAGSSAGGLTGDGLAEYVAHAAHKPVPFNTRASPSRKGQREAGV